MRLPVWSRPTVISRHTRTVEARRASCLETNRQVEKIRRMPRHNAIIEGFYCVAPDPVARRWILRVGKGGSVPIGKRTSDNGVRVRQKRFSRCAVALPYVADFLTVPAPRAHRTCRTRDTGGRRERPSPFGLPGSASQRVVMYTAHSTLRGSLPSIISPCRKAGEQAGGSPVRPGAATVPTEPCPPFHKGS